MYVCTYMYIHMYTCIVCTIGIIITLYIELCYTIFILNRYYAHRRYGGGGTTSEA